MTSKGSETIETSDSGEGPPCNCQSHELGEQVHVPDELTAAKDLHATAEITNWSKRRKSMSPDELTAAKDHHAPVETTNWAKRRESLSPEELTAARDLHATARATRWIRRLRKAAVWM